MRVVVCGAGQVGYGIAEQLAAEENDVSVIDNGVIVAAQSWWGPSAADLAQYDGEVTAQFWDELYGETFSTPIDVTEHEQFFTYSMRWEDGAGITTTRLPMVLDGDEIVGLGVAEGWSGGGPGHTDVERLAPVLPGDCGDGPAAERADGIYEPVVVTQIWSDDLQRPLATIVATSGEVEYTGLGEVADDPAPDGTAALQPPDGDSYQAFVVPAPEVAGCAPLADQRDLGQPGLHTVQYRVDLPGVAESLTGSLWAADPVVVLPVGEDPWYLGRDAWILADRVSAGVEDPHLEWMSLSVGGWALATGGDDPLRDPDCAYVLPVPEVTGAVFLVIDGVDRAAVEAAAPGVEWATDPAEMQTWVFLGNAEGT